MSSKDELISKSNKARVHPSLGPPTLPSGTFLPFLGSVMISHSLQLTRNRSPTGTLKGAHIRTKRQMSGMSDPAPEQGVLILPTFDSTSSVFHQQIFAVFVASQWDAVRKLLQIMQGGVGTRIPHPR